MQTHCEYPACHTVPFMQLQELIVLGLTPLLVGVYRQEAQTVLYFRYMLVLAHLHFWKVGLQVSRLVQEHDLDAGMKAMAPVIFEHAPQPRLFPRSKRPAVLLQVH